MATGGKYDNYHLHDHSYNRKLVYRFLRGAITFHLKYLEVMQKKELLRDYATSFIKNDQDRVAAVRLFAYDGSVQDGFVPDAGSQARTHSSSEDGNTCPDLRPS